jgi:hypothetical protein
MALGLDTYIIGMLCMAYHAGWSNITEKVSTVWTTPKFEGAVPIGRASVNKRWLHALHGVEMCLRLSTAFVGLVQ